MSLGRFPKLSLKSGKWDKKGREKSASKITSGDPFIFEIQVQGNSLQLLRHGKEKKPAVEIFPESRFVPKIP